MCLKQLFPKHPSIDIVVDDVTTTTTMGVRIVGKNDVTDQSLSEGVPNSSEGPMSHAKIRQAFLQIR
jgi:hypothetical protein